MTVKVFHVVAIQLVSPDSSHESMASPHLASHPGAKEGESSLVPRPSTPPAFDRIQYAKTEGEGLGNLLT